MAYKKTGYVVVPQLLSQDELCELSQDCETLAAAPGVHILYEKDSKVVRRIECIYDKSASLASLNLRLKKLLASMFGVEFCLFKDKINFKAPGTAGFRPHYDGTFLWKDSFGNNQKGWFHYASDFINVLVAIDECTIQNGTIEIAPRGNQRSFETYYGETMKDGTPHLREEIVNGMTFEPILLNQGDVVVFSALCAHRSAMNRSTESRRVLYYTYNLASDGDHMDAYFRDKFGLNLGQAKALQ